MVPRGSAMNAMNSLPCRITISASSLLALIVRGDERWDRVPTGTKQMLAEQMLTEQQELAQALRSANLPSLLMVLHQLTGEDRWLEAPYRPQRMRGLDDNDDGGLSPDAQAEVRSAALTALLRLREGVRPVHERPRGEHLLRMMSVCLGEDVPPEYAEMVAVEMGFADEPSEGPAGAPSASGTPEGRSAGPSVVVIGAGAGGLTTALALKRAGIRYRVLERNSDVGGVWLVNDYPGAGVDTPSHLYSWSFLRHRWSSYFARRAEVLDYMRTMTDRFELRRAICFDTTVESTEYDDDAQDWRVTVVDAQGRHELRADVVVSAVGVFGEPVVPGLPGRDSFEGPVFHSSQWPASLDVLGKRVAVVGSGASAMQIVPAIAGVAARVDIFQRSAQWIAPARQYFSTVEPDVQRLLEEVPLYTAWYRLRLGWASGDKRHRALLVDPEWAGSPLAINRTSDRLREFLVGYLTESLAGRQDLIDKQTPDYPPYGKRMLLDNGWYAALTRDDVQLHAAAVTALEPTAVVDATGTSYDADVVVLCTGFAAQRYLQRIRVVGREGAVLGDAWRGDDPKAYLGLMAPGFPNLFFIYGPNTNSGGGSYFSLAESQANYLVSMLKVMIERGWKTVEPTQNAFDTYNSAVDAAHSTMIWAHEGMRSYYRNTIGRVVVNMPWRGVDYWNRIRTPILADLHAESRRVGAAKHHLSPLFDR